MGEVETQFDIEEEISENMNGAVMWERFLSKMVVRVLLVESDVSTRHIISALLRKCNYKVTAVSDGLKAWEILKEKSDSIDLVLTEVELPSISGYPLLSLIMEHEVCKNIPVIMMSSYDSVSTVYKCMLKGASDFLVKPLRKNELRNLWQHVWRKQTSSSATGPGPPEDTVAQQKVEATAENNAVSTHSSGFMASLQRNRECIEKGSDAQSSCTRPDDETEETHTKNITSLSQQKSDNCILNDISSHDKCHKLHLKTVAHDDEGGSNVYAVTLEQSRNVDDGLEQVNVIGQSSDKNIYVLENSCTEAIGFIGTFDNYLTGTFRSSASNVTTNKFDILPMLDLSLKRSNASSSVNQVNDERVGLNHSDASAFSRYINKPFHARISSSPNNDNHRNDHETNSEKELSNLITDYNSYSHDQTIEPRKNKSVSTTRRTTSEHVPSYAQQNEISLPVPIRGVRFDINVYRSVTHQMYDTVHKPISYHFHSRVDHMLRNDTDGTDDQKHHSFKARGNVSPTDDRCGKSSFCSGKISSVSAASGNEEELPVSEGACQRSILREAALAKFRLKRKDRCFDKKVRYESRKKLAEQRPRVKGQFVRHLANNPQSGNSSAC